MRMIKRLLNSLHWKTKSKKQFLRRVCKQIIYEHVRRVIFLSFCLIFNPYGLSKLKHLHKKISFTFKVRLERSAFCTQTVRSDM